MTGNSWDWIAEILWWIWPWIATIPLHLHFDPDEWGGRWSDIRVGFVCSWPREGRTGGGRGTNNNGFFLDVCWYGLAVLELVICCFAVGWLLLVVCDCDQALKVLHCDDGIVKLPGLYYYQATCGWHGKWQGAPCGVSQVGLFFSHGKSVEQYF
jgi:hypothetical protein